MIHVVHRPTKNPDQMTFYSHHLILLYPKKTRFISLKYGRVQTKYISNYYSNDRLKYIIIY